MPLFGTSQMDWKFLRKSAEDTVLFNKGVEEGKRLMMEGAMEGRVILRDMYDNRAKDIDFTIPDNLKIGDKVRIIICKKED